MRNRARTSGSRQRLQASPARDESSSCGQKSSATSQNERHCTSLLVGANYSVTGRSIPFRMQLIFCHGVCWEAWPRATSPVAGWNDALAYSPCHCAFFLLSLFLSCSSFFLSVFYCSLPLSCPLWIVCGAFS